jgi:hypothetical protein
MYIYIYTYVYVYVYVYTSSECWIVLHISLRRRYPRQGSRHLCRLLCQTGRRTLYISINTVSEIMYALSALTRFMTRTSRQHYDYVKQVLHYLKGVKDLKLTWCAQTVTPVSAWSALGFVNASWADDKFSRLSTLYYFLFCNDTTYMEISSRSYPHSLYK